ncbi:MAG: thiamine phosphate synthase [Byssovorax sp.]
MRGLYAIIDTDALARRGVLPVPFAERVIAGRPAAIQLRDKHGSARATLALLRAIAPLAAAAQVPFFANDRPDLALLAGCDGVHVGQDDLPVALIRSTFPRLRVGLSTHDAAQVEQAADEAPDYLAVGPIFATASKYNPSPVVGLAGLRELVARARASRPGLPIVAIGGITRETAGEIGSMVDAVAVIGALLPEAGLPAVEERVRALHATILGERR